MSENYTQYEGGYSMDNITFADIEKAIIDLQETDDEHGTFWFSVFTDKEKP